MLATDLRTTVAIVFRVRLSNSESSAPILSELCTPFRGGWPRFARHEPDPNGHPTGTGSKNAFDPN